MQFHDQLRLLLVISTAGLCFALAAVGVVLLVRPALGAINLQPVLIGVEDMQAGLYATAFRPGAADLRADYPEAAALPAAGNGATLSFTAPEDSSGSVWIWLYREREARDQLYEIFRAGSLGVGAAEGEFTSSESGELEQLGERAVYSSFSSNFPLLNIYTQRHTLTLQRCSAVVTIRMSGTDFATLTAYAQRLDARLQRDVCGWRR